MSNHAILGPSAASRWLTCTPSARFEQFQPNDETSYAREGTIAHEIAALILAVRSGTYLDTHEAFLNDLDILEQAADDFYKEAGTPSEFQTMLDYAEDYAQFVLNLAPHGDVIIGGEHLERNFDPIAKHILIENRYEVFEYVPLGFGTSDHTTRTKKVLYITDYKYGQGVRVSAVKNTQMMLYGLGGLKKAIADGWHEIGKIVLSIYQPRAGGSSSWQISASELIEWGNVEVKPKALQAIAGVGEFVPGKHCQFCKARNVCAAFYEEFETVSLLKDKRLITKDQLNYLLNVGPAVATWIKKKLDDTVQRMQKGDTVEGYKLVKGRTTRTFTSEDAVVDILIGEGYESDEIFNEPVLRSLTDLEKALGKNKFNELLGTVVRKSEGKPALASEDDDRPAISTGTAGYDETPDYSEDDDIL